LLVDIVEQFGRDAVVQVDLGAREHRNRPLDELSPQALAIMTTALRRAGLIDVELAERPPLLTVPAYRARHDRLR